MENYIVIAILLIAIAAAVLRAKKHFKNGCCGSGSTTIREKKTLTEPIIGKKVMVIEGMHCENCAARVENAANRLEGVLCKVNLRKKTATISYSAEIPDELLRQTVESRGYTVRKIQN